MTNIIKLTFLKITLLCVATVLTTSVFSQSPYISKSVDVDANGNHTYTFTAKEALIEQDYPLDYTHPEAAYTYFWSLGDGAYFFGNSVTYSYKLDETVDIRLIGTPVYAPTLPPPAFTSTESVKKGNNTPLNNDGMLLLSRDPRPEFNSLVIINYENILTTTVKDAKLRFYFRSDYFQHLSEDLFNLETNQGLTSDGSLMPKYDNYFSYDVGDLLSGEKHTVMINAETLLAAMGELGEDLPTLYLKAELYYEDVDRFGNVTTKLIQEKEIETEAVGGWDPNDKVAITDDFFYNQMGYQEFVEYQINFQNIGTGPAKSVYIVDTFSTDFDSSTFVLTDYYHPKIASYNGFSYTFDKNTRELKATFKNINLSGTNQPSITNEELTKGYIKFKIKTQQKSIFSPSLFVIRDSCLPYYSIENKGYITFDNNDTIETNTAQTYFYVSSNALCLKSKTRSSPTKESFDIIPNPIKGKTIKIVGRNLDASFNGFTSSNTNLSIYTSTFNKLACSQNITYGSGKSANQITISSNCLNKGIYYVLVNYNNSVHRLALVVS